MNRYLILNIGLNCNDGTKLDPVTAIQKLLRTSRHLRLEAVAVHTSDTEPTLVASVYCDKPLSSSAWMLLSVRCKQDAIAVYDVEAARGELHGPKAAEWGPFNPAFFLLLDGIRLSELLAQRIQ